MADENPIINAMKVITRDRVKEDPLNDEYDGIDEITFKKFLRASKFNTAFYNDFLNLSVLVTEGRPDTEDKMKEIFNKHNIGNLTDRGAKSMCSYAFVCALFVANKNKRGDKKCN